MERKELGEQRESHRGGSIETSLLWINKTFPGGRASGAQCAEAGDNMG